MTYSNSPTTRIVRAFAAFAAAVVLPLPIVVAYAYVANGHYMALLRAGVAPPMLGALMLVLTGLATVMLQRWLHGERGLPDALLLLTAKPAGGLVAATVLMALGGGAACVLGSRCSIPDGGFFFYRFLLPGLPYILLAALYEELYFREAMYRALQRAFGRADVALVLQAVIFGFAHYPWVREVAIAMGLWYGVARLWSGSIWVSALVHAVSNLLTFALYGRVGMPIHLLQVTPPGAETPFAAAVVAAGLCFMFVGWRRAAARTRAAAYSQY